MTTSGVVSFARTRSPSCTVRAPVRPEIGAMMSRVLKVQPGVLDLRLIGGERRLERRGRGRLRLVLVARNQAALEEILVARVLRLSVLRLRRIPRQNGLRLLERRLERPGVQREEGAPFLTSCPSGK